MGEISVLDRVGAEYTPMSYDFGSNVRPSEEITRYTQQQAELSDLPLTIEVSELPMEQELRVETARLVGSIGVAEALSVPRTAMSLMEAAKRAHSGEVEARKLVETNTLTDYIERTYKSGHVIRVELDTNTAGQLIQHGQTLEEVTGNSLAHLKHPVLRARGEIEAHNARRQQYCYEQGLLKDRALLTFSTVPDRITRAEAKRIGFFTETMSCAIQMITEEDDKVVIYSAFVAGSDADESERFDFTAIEELSKKLNIDYTGLSADQILARPALVHKQLLPEGILSIVKMYDQYDSAKKRFFGRNEADQKDYQAHMTECRRREQESSARVEKVVNQILEASPNFTVPTDATRLLDELNDMQLKVAITTDLSIDSNVLGQQAQQYVDSARMYARSGNHQAFLEAQYQMLLKGSSTSCPTDPDSEEQLSNEKNSNERSEKLADCDFISKQCPKCGEKNVYTKCRAGKYYGSCGCSS
jgi:hypothetical protein